MAISKFPAVFAAAILVAPRALPRGGAIARASSPSPFDLSPLPRSRAALFFTFS